MIIEGKRQIVGRVCAFAAKMALEGNRVDIVNCEEMIITGDKKSILERYRKLNQKDPIHGPFLKKMPDMLVKRMIRGMLPYKQERGRDALKKIRCYIGIPNGMKDKEKIKARNADITKLKIVRYITVGQVSKEFGKKW